MGLLTGKTALITGGARGQGRAHAVRCAQEGADVVLVDILERVATAPYPMATREDMELTVKEVEKYERSALAVTADVRSQPALDDAVRQALSQFGSVDILIANAGIWDLRPFTEMTDEAWFELIDINLHGVYRSVRSVVPHMIERQQGSIVITSSINGLEPGPNYAHYVTAKHGLIGLMRSLALELGPQGIRVNAISPGAIDTPMTDHQAAYDMFAGHEGGTADERWEGGFGFGTLKGTSFLPPEVIADAALYLNSDLARAVTGVVLPVDAGHMALPGMNPNPVKG